MIFVKMKKFVFKWSWLIFSAHCHFLPWEMLDSYGFDDFRIIRFISASQVSFFYSIGQYICNVFDFPYKTINFGKLDISYLCTDSQHIKSNLTNIFNIYFTNHEFWKCWWKFKPIPQNEEKTCSNIVNIVDALSTLIHIFVVFKIMHKAFT